MYELAAVKPVWLEVAKGFIPTPEILTNNDMLYTAIGILGETDTSAPSILYSCIWHVRAAWRMPSWLTSAAGGQVPL